LAVHALDVFAHDHHDPVSQIDPLVKKLAKTAKGSPTAYYSILTTSWVDPTATYYGCTNCHRKVANGALTCPSCPPQVATTSAPEHFPDATILPQYSLRCSFLDETGGFSYVVFSEPAQQMMDNTDPVLFANLPEEEQQKQLQRLCWRKFKVFYLIKRKKTHAGPSVSPASAWGIDIVKVEAITAQSLML